MKKILAHIRNHYIKILLIVILLVASFMRLYKISDYMTFLGDEGRDVLIAKGILEGDFVFLGPRSSAADFFYGPIYYYMITPFLFLFNFDPVGPAVMVALFGVATVYLIYKIAKEFFGNTASLVAASLYSVAPLIIGYSRSSWNPNPLPFFSLLMLYVLYKATVTKSFKLFCVVGILLGIAFQLQYLATFLAVIIGSYIFFGTWYTAKKIDLLLLAKRYIILLIGFVIGWSPFLAFEIKHGFPNIRTIVTYVTSPPASNKLIEDTTFIGRVSGAFMHLFSRLLVVFPPVDQLKLYDQTTLFLWQLSIITIAIISLFFIFRIKNKLQRLLIAHWAFLGIVLFGFYKEPMYDYHFGFLFPLPFLLVGNMVGSLSKIKNFRIVGVIIFIVLLVLNLYHYPFKHTPNKQKDQVKGIVEFVIAKTAGKPFNFALITPGNSDHGYRYYFDILGHKPVTLENTMEDPERRTVTDQLMVVCEDTSCGPLGHPLFEVSAFGRAEVAGEWDTSVVKVFKLVHYREDK